jgi:Protein of unknown function (DUF1570)/Leucine Rich repeat
MWQANVSLNRKHLVLDRHPLAQLAWIVLLQTVWLCPAGKAQAESQNELRIEFGSRLVKLADKCDELGLGEQASITRSWLVPRGPERQYLFTNHGTNPHRPSDNDSDLVKFWHRKFVELRADHAKSLFKLAKETVERGDGTMAYQLLHEVLHHDPGHRDARRILGLAPTNSMRIARRPGKRTHADFNWRRGDYWQIESEHYRITTNESANAGVELAKKLEAFHSVWQQVFFRYWSADESLAERFRGGNARLGRRKKMAVVLFADRDEYIKQLERYEPQIAMSLGYYMKGEQKAFFYAGDATVEPTWYHEATHQLFQELGNAIADVGETSNFWIVEGIAVYMESLVAHDGYMTLGGVDAERLQYARVRALTGEFYLPLNELVRLGREDLQRHEDIRRIYTQAAGLTYFLMDGAKQEYRQALVDFITMLYLGRAQPTTLASRCGVELESLDDEYAKFLVVQDDDLVHLNPPSVVKNLALGRTKVTDVGVKRLGKHTDLQWLDLSYTRVSDSGIAHLANATSLRRLNLEGTTITGKSLEIVSQFSQLEELDLSGTKITDAGVASLAKLKHLQVVWLTGTSVTDACLEAFQDSKQLEFLEVSQTRVTTAALQKKLPQLTQPSDKLP